MGIELPMLEYVPSWVLGGEWPDGDEDKVWEMAEAWSSASTSVTDCVNNATDSVNGLLANYQGPAADALRSFWAERQAAIAELAQACDELAQYCDGTALQIQYTKLSIIANLLILVATIISLIAAAVATFGASTAGIPIAQQVTAMTVRELIKQLLLAILKGALKGLVMSLAIDGIIQVFQIATGKRDGYDVEQAAKAGLRGAIAGGIAGGAGFGAGRIPVTGPLATAAVNGAAGAAAGAAGAAAGTLATGGSLSDAANAAANGWLAGGVQGAAGGLHGATRDSVALDRNGGPIPYDWGTPIENMPPAGNRGYVSPEGVVTRPATPTYGNPPATGPNTTGDWGTYGQTGSNVTPPAPGQRQGDVAATQEEINQALGIDAP